MWVQFPSGALEGICMRKHNVKEIHLELIDVRPFSNEKYSGMILVWSSDIGFGEYTIWQEDGKWYGDSECMDSSDDKEFLQELLHLFLKQISVS